MNHIALKYPKWSKFGKDRILTEAQNMHIAQDTDISFGQLLIVTPDMLHFYSSK